MSEPTVPQFDYATALRECAKYQREPEAVLLNKSADEFERLRAVEETAWAVVKKLNEYDYKPGKLQIAEHDIVVGFARQAAEYLQKELIDAGSD